MENNGCDTMLLWGWETGHAHAPLPLGAFEGSCDNQPFLSVYIIAAERGSQAVLELKHTATAADDNAGHLCSLAGGPHSYFVYSARRQK